MCGIVGYWGPHQPKDVIINGLKKLEYRGYDSAGVAILDHGQFKVVRASGKLSELQKKLDHENFDGHIGIGHTRWATHGVPSERNAHPHSVDGVSLVHNGIIENYQEIKLQLAQEGVQFSSDTDSELVAHLIARDIAKSKDLLKSVQNILPLLRGAYSIVVVWKNQPDTLVAFKNGPPLIVGIGEKEVVIASDVQAIVDYTKNIIYLEDFETIEVKATAYKIFGADSKLINKKPHLIEWNAKVIEKSGYDTFMLKEIFEEPRAVASALAPHIDLEKMQVHLKGLGISCDTYEQIAKMDPVKDAVVSHKALAQIERVFIIACGTSFYAGQVGEYLIENFAKVPVECDIASEFRYRDPVIPQKSMVIVVSQSGETADTLAALRLAKQAGALTLSITNVMHSSIDREAKAHLYLNAGTEVGVASTKAFVATLAIFNLLALQIAKVKDQITAAQEKQILQALLAAPSQMEAVLAYDKFFNEAASHFKEFKGLLYMGRGVSFPLAMEGALKLKELAYMHAEGYAAGEMKHGPLALIDERMLIVMVAPRDKHFEKTLSNLQEAKARGGKIISIGTGECPELKDLSEYYLSLPKAEWYVNPLLEIIPLQLLAYHVARAHEYDVDQPRNLAKSVTVE